MKTCSVLGIVFTHESLNPIQSVELDWIEKHLINNGLKFSQTKYYKLDYEVRIIQCVFIENELFVKTW